MQAEDAASGRPIPHTDFAPTNLYFAEPDQFEEFTQATLGTRDGHQFSIATHRRDRAGLGPTAPSPVGPSYLVVVQLSAGGRFDLFCDARHDGRGALRRGRLNIMDMRHLWVADLQGAFRSFSFVIPQSMLDELTYDLRQPRITSLRCPSFSEKEDDVILSLARALYPALKRPEEISALTATHMFEAANVHLAQHYGGLSPDSVGSISALSAWQARRAKELLSDGIGTSPTLDELGRVCDLPAYRFAKAFEKTFGAAPHRWLAEHRMQSAKNLLVCTKQSLDDIATFCGFASRTSFGRAFVKQFGITPDRFRSNALN